MKLTLTYLLIGCTVAAFGQISVSTPGSIAGITADSVNDGTVVDTVEGYRNETTKPYMLNGLVTTPNGLGGAPSISGASVGQYGMAANNPSANLVVCVKQNVDYRGHTERWLEGPRQPERPLYIRL